MDKSGNFYGMTYWGSRPPFGTVFKLKANGIEKVLHTFSSGKGGKDPMGGVTMNQNGNLYGTTCGGGTGFRYGEAGYGVVFELIGAKGPEKTLFMFGGSNGSCPQAGVIVDQNGNLYGTTSTGGGEDNYGTVFKLTPAGEETVLYSFCSQPECGDGALPLSELIMDASGNLYGTTTYGGADGLGTVFELSPSGTETVLHNFGGTDGVYPTAGLIMDQNGSFYGTTIQGGTYNEGTVFEMVP